MVEISLAIHRPLVSRHLPFMHPHPNKASLPYQPNLPASRVAISTFIALHCIKISSHFYHFRIFCGIFLILVFSTHINFLV